MAACRNNVERKYEEEKLTLMRDILIIGITGVAIPFIAASILVFASGFKPAVSSEVFGALLTAASILFGFAPAVTFYCLDRVESTKRDSLATIRDTHKNLRILSSTCKIMEEKPSKSLVQGVKDKADKI